VNSETDFVARNELFQALVRTVAELGVAGNGDVDVLAGTAYPGTGRSVAEEISDLVGRIGENMVLRRVTRLTVGNGLVASYMHNSLSPNLGKIGVLIALESTAPADTLAALGRQLAMHVAAANPLYLDRASVSASTLEREREVLRGQAETTGKSVEIIDKMVEGRLRKFYEDSVLLDQVYVIDGESRVGKVVEAAAKAAGTPIAVTGFARFSLGEGIDKPVTDLATEVAAQLKH
jgi:elongation factor Ts